MGTKIGAGLSRENRPRFYMNLDFKNIKYLLTIPRLWATDDVALQPKNVSHCLITPKAYQPGSPDKRSNKYEEELEKARLKQQLPMPRRRLRL